MQKKLSLYPDKGISLEGKEKATTSSEGLSFTQNESLQHPSEASPPSTRDTKKCLVKKSRRGYLTIPFGTTPSNYSQEPLPRYPDNSSPSPRARLPKHRSL